MIMRITGISGLIQNSHLGNQLINANKKGAPIFKYQYYFL